MRFEYLLFQFQVALSQLLFLKFLQGLICGGIRAVLAMYVDIRYYIDLNRALSRRILILLTSDALLGRVNPMLASSQDQRGATLLVVSSILELLLLLGH